MTPLPLALALACSAAAPVPREGGGAHGDGPRAVSLALADGWDLEVRGTSLVLHDASGPRTLTDQLVGLPAAAAAGRIVSWSEFTVSDGKRRREDVAVVRLTLDGPEPTRAVLSEHPSADRVALRPDGAQVVWVAGVDGVAGLWSWSEVRPWAEPLTNAQLEAVPGERPAGFVPVPHLAPPTFVQERDTWVLVWASPEGEHRLELP